MNLLTLTCFTKAECVINIKQGQIFAVFSVRSRSSTAEKK